jgi:hypothetical protein
VEEMDTDGPETPKEAAPASATPEVPKTIPPIPPSESDPVPATQRTVPHSDAEKAVEPHSETL